jgi:hypothetical protein
MAARAGEGYVLLVKKLYGLFLIILGSMLTAAGVSYASTGLIVFGILALIAGAILLVLKIVRRNQDSWTK